MRDNEFYIARDAKASLVSIISPKFKEHKNEIETQRSLLELRELLKTLGPEVGYEYIQKRKQPEPATILGAGKLKEIAFKAKEEGSDLLVFDFELTAGQIRNIKKLTGLSVVDRVHVILEIFAQHAKTREAKIQIEIARLQYLLPRLSGMWGHLGRQKGGVGVRGGEGEQQIELDRRMIRNRIEHYKKELEQTAKSREQQGKKRQSQTLTVALVGYTNSGKSSLMNRMCLPKVLEENKLFSTLDSTFRTLSPDTQPPIVLVDTVGFISNLPNTLIDGFKTTLESALEANLLVIVVDISAPNYKQHIKVTNKVLEELGVGGRERFIVFNKKDLLNNPIQAKITKRIHPNSVVVSSFAQEDMKMLREKIIQFCLRKQKRHDIFVPYEEGSTHAAIAGKCNIVKQTNHETGIYYRIHTPDFIFNQMKLKQFVLSPNELPKSHSGSG